MKSVNRLLTTSHDCSAQTMCWNVLKAVRQPVMQNISMQEPHNRDDIS